MLYAALTLWLLVIVFTAWGVHFLLTRLVKPRVVNVALLPGTLVAQLGHVLGMLITGNSVRNTALMRDDETGDPQSEPPDRQRLPVVGAVVVGLLPLLACATSLYYAAHAWGGSIVSGAPELPTDLPRSLADFWSLLRFFVSSAEQTLTAIIQANLTQWQSLLFLYLSICLTVRMAPFEGIRRGALVAILLSGAIIALIGLIFAGWRGAIESAWPILSFAVGMLILLLVISLLISAVVGLIRIASRSE
ncbi:MAG: hypothetical protein KDA32_13690 [Phycisphaerales bacterium]|nr:hypothetical protein [Phycisphaerales bacterium]